MPTLREMTIDLEPLRASRDFRLLWMGSTVSSIGTQITRVAVPFLVFKATGDPFALGLISAITFAPMLVSSIVGGAIADAYERRRIAQVSAAVGALASIVHALNAGVGEPRLWLLYVTHAVGTCVTMAGAPAMRSALPFLVEERMLTSALMVQSTTYTSSSVVGPALAGFILASGGPVWAFIIDALTFGWSFVCLTMMKPIPPRDGVARKVSGAFIIDGFRALRGRKPIIGSFLADINAMVFGMPIAIFPAIHAERWADNPRYLGFLYSAIPAGMFAASIFSGWTRNVTRHGMVVILSIVVWGLAIVAFGLIDGFAISLVCLAIAGAADMVSGVSRNAMLQLSATPEIQGRLQGVGMAVWTSGPALGDFEAGTVAGLWSVDGAVWSGGLLCIAGIGVIALAFPEFTRFRVGDGTSAGAEPVPSLVSSAGAVGSEERR